MIGMCGTSSAIGGWLNPNQFGWFDRQIGNIAA
jgi:hypothetical protein